MTLVPVDVKGYSHKSEDQSTYEEHCLQSDVVYEGGEFTIRVRP